MEISDQSQTLATVLLECLTFLHKLSPGDPLSDLLLVAEMSLASKCAVEPVSEILITKGIFSSHPEKFCGSQSACAPKNTLALPFWCNLTFVHGDDLPAQLRVDHR